MQVSDVTGDVDLQNDNGEIQLMTVGGTATLRTKFGKVEAFGVRKALTVTNDNGGVTVRDAGAAVTVKTKFGPAVVERSAGFVSAWNDNGAITVSQARAGVTATTKFAAVKLEGITGAVDVINDNGPIAVTDLRRSGAGKCDPVRLSTRFGSIDVGLPADADYDLSASTKFGKIQTNVAVTVQGQLQPEQVTGRIGRGGCELKLFNDNGGITINGVKK
jgi:hypothetical protein